MAQATPPQSSEPGTATPIIWRRACVACTKAKRHCTKQVPSCRRCTGRRIPCSYPPARPALEAQVPATSSSDYMAHATLDPGAALVLEQCRADASALATTTNIASPTEQAAPNEADLDTPNTLPRSASQSMIVANIPPNTGEREADWFLAQQSFLPERTVPEEFLLDLPTNLRVDQILHFVDLMKKWLKEWVTNGHSPLHHRQLYHNRMPRCVQDAYGTMALYFLAKSPSNQNGIFQLIDDRVTQLFEDQMQNDELLQSAGSSCSQTRDLFGRLSRVQALVAYQIVRLFDGDIRMRARAEADLPMQTAWTKDLWVQTRNSIAPAPGGDASTSPLNQSIPFDGLVSLDEAVVTWKLWILTESIRRTWLASNLVMELYHYIKHGWSQCPGSIPFTMRAGLWEAGTAAAWFVTQRKQDALFVHIFRQPEMMESVSPGQVDEFGHAVLGITWGLERMARWHDRMGENLGNNSLAERVNFVSS
ncbi:hypothetical protein PG993_008937 [Apiospora rasikravindrae]|uniref:Zn(2)-C6 fungal-type domain-containing protein n=1 Tax=Apiospora rasikravindrae TaxID=990691 RepID=A0ABR1SPS1_9PEZI